MQRMWPLAMGLLVVVLGAAVVLGFLQGKDDATAVSNVEDTAIRAVVTEFGGKLKLVSLLGPDRATAMDLYYKPYVAPELIAKWAPEGAEGALGRYASSPWPERIEVAAVTKEGGKYVVEANVIEVTQQASTTQVAAVYPLKLTLEKRDERWVITASEKGAYSQIPTRQTIVGLWECLPHKDTSGPQTMECAFGIAVDQSDAHYAVNTSLMAQYPVDFPTGTKVRIEGLVTPANQLSADHWQKYDIDGIISATTIQKL